MFHVKTKFCLFVRSQFADIGPPLGTILGNMGVNAVKFVKDFNDFTKNLPSYFFLKVHIFILEDRSYTFLVSLPTTGFILSFIKIIKFINNNRKQGVVFLKDIIQLSLLKFPQKPLRQSFPVILGTVKSCGLVIVL